jgi:hypothetical protein
MPKLIRRLINLSPDLDKALRKEARREKVSITEIVRIALEAYLK